MRIEPTFIIAILIQYLILVLVFKPDLLKEITESLLNVISYTSNIFKNNLINGVTWSLEIEMQFYLLLPLLLMLKKSSNKYFYCFIVLLVVLFSLLIPLIGFKSLINYFLVGILVAILQKNKTLINTYFIGSNLLLVFLLFMLADKSIVNFLSNLYLISILRLTILFWLFNNVLILRKGIRFLAMPIISTLGRMCYTIYLYHILILSFFTRLILSGIKDFIESDILFFCFGILLMCFSSLIFSSLFFVLFEKPFMKKNWPSLMKKNVNLFFARLL